jgi:hypothetical protein
MKRFLSLIVVVVFAMTCFGAAVAVAEEKAASPPATMKTPVQPSMTTPGTTEEKKVPIKHPSEQEKVPIEPSTGKGKGSIKPPTGTEKVPIKPPIEENGTPTVYPQEQH